MHVDLKLMYSCFKIFKMHALCTQGKSMSYEQDLSRFNEHVVTTKHIEHYTVHYRTSIKRSWNRMERSYGNIKQSQVTSFLYEWNVSQVILLHHTGQIKWLTGNFTLSHTYRCKPPLNSPWHLHKWGPPKCPKCIGDATYNQKGTLKTGGIVGPIYTRCWSRTGIPVAIRLLSIAGLCGRVANPCDVFGCGVPVDTQIVLHFQYCTIYFGGADRFHQCDLVLMVLLTPAQWFWFVTEPEQLRRQNSQWQIGQSGWWLQTFSTHLISTEIIFPKKIKVLRCFEGGNPLHSLSRGPAFCFQGRKQYIRVCLRKVN